jgi:putative membrane protein
VRAVRPTNVLKEIPMRRLAVLTSVALLATPLAASGATRAAAGPLDQHYLMNGIEGDHFEIQGGNLALGKGQCAAVTRLAKRLKADHSKSLAEAAQLARSMSVSVPKGPAPSMQWELKQVGAMTGPTFDKAYASLELKDHIEDIQNTTEEIAKGQTAAVRASARKELPMLRAHLALSRAATKTC